MRWLGVVVLGACSFTPGVLPNTGVIDAGDDDAPVQIDAPGPESDAPDGTAPQAGKVRLLDIMDAKVTGGPHINFPVLVSISGTWLRSQAFSGDVVRNDGFDIWFSSDQLGAMPLAHQVEVYAPNPGTLLAWVKLPMLTPQTNFYIHYGDPSITASKENTTGVWDGGYELVAHLSTVADATNKAGAISSAVGAAVAGKIHLATTFDGASHRIDYGSDPELDNVFTTDGGTVEGWFFAASFGEASLGRLMDKAAAGGWQFALDDSNRSGSMIFQHGGAGVSVGSWLAPSDSVTTMAWHHAAVVYDKGAGTNNAVMYLDGAPVVVSVFDSPTAPLDTDASSSLVVGNRATDRTFDGLLDEMRVSSISRTADWIGTQYRNHNEPGTFLTPGPEL